MANTVRFEEARAELSRIERRLKKLVDAIVDGVPVRTLKDELIRLERRQDELNALLVEAEPRRTPLVHPNLAEVYRKKVAVLHEALQDEDTMAEATELIRSLVDEIVLTPENGELRIDLKGELASILTLSTGSKKPVDLSGDGLEQIKMVAGVGFEPTTFRL